MNHDRESAYNYYAEQLTQVMLQQDLIFEEDQQDIERFIRGCA